LRVDARATQPQPATWWQGVRLDTPQRPRAGRRCADAAHSHPGLAVMHLLASSLASSVHNACIPWAALQALPTRAGPVGRVVMHVPAVGPAGWLPRALTHLCGARCLLRQDDSADSDATVRPPTPPCLTSRCARRGTRPPHARARARARLERVQAPLDPLTRSSSRFGSAAKGHGRRARASACGGPRPPRAARQLGPGALRPAQCSRGRWGGRRGKCRALDLTTLIWCKKTMLTKCACAHSSSVTHAYVNSS
jgi:hypothetical protein